MSENPKTMKRWESWGKPVWAAVLSAFVGWMFDASPAQRMILFFVIMCWFEILTHRHHDNTP